MNNRMCGLILALSLVANAIGGELMSSARSATFSIDSVTVTNSTLTVDGSKLPLRLDYSPSLWNDVNGQGGTVRITANEETILEATQDGTFQWIPSIEGLYTIKHIAANGTTISKQFKVVVAKVTIEREGYNLCRLTASDGVSEIRYTTDGTTPTAASALYTGPFEVSPSRLSLVRAATFAVGYLKGEVSSAQFSPVASFVSVAQANCAIDNSGEVRQIGYDAIPLPYDTTWEGDAGSSVELLVGGALIARRTGAGDVAWTPEHEGLTALTMRTVNASGGTEAEYSAQYDVVPRTVIITNGTDEVASLNELYPGLCHWITNIVIETGVTNLGKQVEFDSGNWLPVDASGTDRLSTYRSNSISHNGQTEMSMTVEGPLDWSFRWKVSSEGNYDWLRWSLDGVEKAEISGTGSGWQEVLCSIPDGEHVVRWAYTKDGSQNSGDDCGWVAFDLPVNSSAIFEGCNGLTSVTMPWKLVAQMQVIFPGSYDKLETITLTGEPTAIPDHAFEGCAALRTIDIPSTVTSIGTSAFSGCSNLTEVVIPRSVWDIGDGAFSNCSGLQRVQVAGVLKSKIEACGVFDGCPDDMEIVYISPEIHSVTAKQRYPWNGKVDVSFEVVGDLTAGLPAWNRPVLSLSATDRTTGSNYVANASALSGDTGTEEGKHYVIWDLNAHGLELKSGDVVFTVSYEIPPKYCVIDLSAGADAESYPVSYLTDVPDGGWADEYKTTKLVLRRIEPGAFKMCGDYDVTLTLPYYMGVFEVTQKQYELVTGGNPSLYKGDMRPVERVSWNTIRGDSNTYNWPSSSNVDTNTFMGKIRSRTGLNFDLPTEAQWEYACRAGTTSSYNNGSNDENALAQLGRYNGNRSDGKGGYSQHTIVGSYLSNDWGLYDMHGNVLEWCLDFAGDISNISTDPVGPLSGSTIRIQRGGSWNDNLCASNVRNQQHCWHGSSSAGDFGFRLARTLLAACDDEIRVDGDEICSGDSLFVAIDSRIEPVVDSVAVSWDASWIGGDLNATVVIVDNGTEIRRASGVGEFAYTSSTCARLEQPTTSHE